MFVIRTLSLTALIVCGSVAQGHTQDCLRSVYTNYADAQRAWQRSVRDIIIAGRQEVADLAQLSTELQLAMIDEAAARFQYLVDHIPERLKPDSGLAEFVNIGLRWSESDDDDLMARDANYRALRARVAQLRARSDGHPDWPALRTYVSAELRTRAAYTEALERYESAVRALEGRLATCNPL